MSSSSIYTHQRAGIDNSVWVSMLTCVVLSAGLLGYNVSKRAEVKPCEPIEILVNGRAGTESVALKAGDVLSFRPSVSSGDKIVWDFGDDTKTEEGFYTTHIYAKAGPFTVRALVNGMCSSDKKVNIADGHKITTDTEGNEPVSISGREDANTGEKLTFSTILPASDYEWRVENNGNYPVQKGKQASFTFRSQGNYTVVLMLDHNSQRKFRKHVAITKLIDPNAGLVVPGQLIHLPPPKPVDSTDHNKPQETVKPVPEPVKKKFKGLSNELFRDYLQYIVCNVMQPADMNDYLCHGDNTPVIDVHNKKHPTTTIGLLYKELQNNNIKIESVTAARDEDGCVINLTVSYDKKWKIVGIGRNPCKD